jgi:hypothetical protein
MTRRLLIVFTGVMLAVMAGAAAARDSVSFSVSIGTPAFIVPAPVYYVPPPPVYFLPAAVYYAPPVVYSGAPVHVVPVRPLRHYQPPRHWHRHQWHDHGRRR